LGGIQVLRDEDRRRTYDVISGFSPDSENPFMDINYPRDQVRSLRSLGAVLSLKSGSTLALQ
jgi:hypothetical protein